MSGLGQHIELAQNFAALTNSQHARNIAHESAISASKAQKNTERLYMVVQAMWELLREKVGLTDSDLEAKVQEIDLRDGRLDGKDANLTATHACRQCGRTILSGQSACSWCGAHFEGGVFSHAR